MLTHYVKIAFRSLFADRFFSLINILGLSAGIASVSIIFLFVAHQLSYDTWLPNYTTLYRIDTVEATPGRPPAEIARAPGPLRDALIKDFPQIESVARGYLTPASVIRNGQPFAENVLAADPNFFSVLGLPFEKGTSQEAIKGTTSVALSTRKARELFGDTDPIGQSLSILVPEAKDFVVSAVFATIPENSHLAIDIVIPLEGYFRDADDDTRSIPEQWGGAYFHTYARLKQGAAVAAVEKGIPAFVDRNLPPAIATMLSTAPHDFYNFKFVPVAAVHFDGASIMAMKPQGDRGTAIALSAVGLLILLIASINFANLTSARSLLRFREVALRKVVGADRRNIISQFLVEAVLITAIAAVISVVAMVVVLPYIGDMLGEASALALTGSWGIWALLMGIVLVVAIGAGLYPALVVAGIRPGLILNRDFLRGGTSRLRSTFVVLQFAVSIALMTITFGMVAQTRYAQQIDLGFDRSNVLIVRVPQGPRQAIIADGFKQAVSRSPDVMSVALSSAVPSDPSEDNVTVNHPSSAKPIQLGFHKVDSSFFRMLGTAPTVGRTSSMRRAEAAAPLPPGEERSVSAVINRAALKALGFASPDDAIGEVIREGNRAYTIVGVVPDLHFRSLRQPVRDELYALDESAGGVVSIRYRPGAASRVVAVVDQIWSERVPDRAIDRAFLDDALNGLYVQENRQTTLLALFAAVAILLSCLGLLAMAAYSVQRRTKEIAIRKVLGAGSGDILKLLLWQSCRPVMIANLFAWPVAWWVLTDWLNKFAYRIEMPYLAFAISGLAALVIAVIAISVHTAKVARLRPVVALRNE